MSKTKLTIVFYTMTGTNLQMAIWAKEAAEATGAEVRLRKVKELASDEIIAQNPAWKETTDKMKDIEIATNDDLVWADAILFSTPTRYGNISAQLKEFIDSTGGLFAKGLLVNKAVSAMTSTNNPHGGQEQTILQLYTSVYHWGAIVVAPGFIDEATYAAGGNPYGTSATRTREGIVDKDNVKGAIGAQVKRLLEIANKLK